MSVVAIVGRPNVGKSSLFNRLVGKKLAIVEDIPGVTRDRLYAETEWDGKRFYLVDTGGIEPASPHPFQDAIRRQVEIALKECDVVIFLLDGKEGVTAGDEAIAEMLRRSSKPVVVAMNKIDNPKREDNVLDAYSLGFPLVMGISVEHGINMGDLLDAVASSLPDDEPVEDDEGAIRFSIVGRPNVGKSSLFNRLIGEERAVVSPIPGTTRDTVDVDFQWNQLKFRIMDTAGLRRKSRVDDSLEYYSVVRTLKAIDRSHVALLLMDASEMLTEQDKRLMLHVEERGKGLVIGVNKWDLLTPSEDLGDRIRDRIRDELPTLSYAPMVFLSAKTGRGIQKVPELIARAYNNRLRRLKTADLNRLLRDTLQFERMPGDGKGRYLKIYYVTQADMAPPTFIFFVNHRELADRSFTRRLEKLIRSMGDFEGTPIRIWFRNKEDQSQ
ncbi:ribosome-associated GTPase EngA [Thermanaerovibrio velox DSM 12556]|uniref:GTPase Der n=1 Tax=Thermanaerovibrio velox DSM 12556 TaxID=926567 RepID=H0US42_9BACT|nr:ribosome biogenesis GTPase Der [Thermanaerovibrio velox]EHM10131.1 ribosome-associated GTPase EngA [Thermanaerovibrio velox DSM 12556]